MIIGRNDLLFKVGMLREFDSGRLMPGNYDWEGIRTEVRQHLHMVPVADNRFDEIVDQLVIDLGGPEPDAFRLWLRTKVLGEEVLA